MGRPRTIHPPPSAAKSSGAVSDFLRVTDSERLAETANLSPVDNQILDVVCREINDAFSWFATRNDVARGRDARVRIHDWFERLSTQSGELIRALGHDKPYVSLGASFEDTGLHVFNIFPPSATMPTASNEDRHALHQIERLLRQAAPEVFADAIGKNPETAAYDVTFNVVGKRLRATLQLLSLIASRGASHHRPLIKRGGRTPEGARKQLFSQLAGQYKVLFGELPTVPSPTVKRANEKPNGRVTLPGGKALSWFLGLLALLGSQPQRTLDELSSEISSREEELTPLLTELVNLSLTADKSTAKDGLAHWIREGAADWAKRECKAITNPAHGDTSDPLNGLFG